MVNLEFYFWCSSLRSSVIKRGESPAQRLGQVGLERVGKRQAATIFTGLFADIRSSGTAELREAQRNDILHCGQE
jgi:hypothetical protein